MALENVRLDHPAGDKIFPPLPVDLIPLPAPPDQEDRLDPIEEPGCLESLCDFCRSVFDCLASLFCFFCSSQEDEINDPLEEDSDITFEQFLFDETIPEENLDKVLEYGDQIREINLAHIVRYRNQPEKMTALIQQLPELRAVTLPSQTTPELLKAIRQHCLKVVWLDCRNIRTELTGLMEEISQFSQLQGLDFSASDEVFLTDEHLEQLASGLHELGLLNLTGQINLEGKGVVKLIEANPHLEILILDGCKKIDEEHQQIAGATKNLKALILNANYTFAIEIPALQTYLAHNPGLRCLFLSAQYNAIELREEIGRLPLEYLDLSQEDQMDPQFTSDDVFAEFNTLFDWASSMPDLKYFILGYPNLSIESRFLAELKKKSDKKFCIMGIWEGEKKMIFHGSPYSLAPFESVNPEKREGALGYEKFLVRPFIEEVINIPNVLQKSDLG